MADDGVLVSINTAEFEGAMQRLRDGVRDGFIDPKYGTLPVQARLLAEQCQKFTPPRNKGQGQAAVARDMTAVYAPQSQTTYTNKRVRRIVMRDDREGWNSYSKNIKGPLKNTRAIAFDESLHDRTRRSRGRITRRKMNIGFVTLGPQGRLARAYIKKIKQLVGWAKAGWNNAIISLGGTVSVDWVGRHNMGHGGVIRGYEDPNNPYIKVSNNTGWARVYSAEGERIIRNAIEARVGHMKVYATQMALLAKARANQMLKAG